jgi:Hint domain
MPGNTIDHRITIGVVLGSNYASPLTITHPGDIAPSSYGETALYVRLGGGYVLNKGTVSGGPGSYGAPGTGGIGVYLHTGSVANFGTIAGGAGGAGTIGGSAGGSGFVGGNAVDLYSGSLTNFGVILGAAGGAGGAGTGSDGIGGAGGAGVYELVFRSGSGLTNQGSISGGAGGTGGGTASSGAGGVGVNFPVGGTLTDSGFIAGGIGAGGRADAVAFGSGASRLILQPGASFTGSVVADASFSNVIELASGASGGTLSGYIGAGIAYEYIGFGTLTVDSGASWTTGRAVSVASAVVEGALTNRVHLTSFNGIDLTGGTLINDGRIYGYHGAAVYAVAGGTLVNAGSIRVSAGGDAVIFGTGASRLVLYPGARTNGTVVANASYSDVLELGSGATTGLLSNGIGVGYRGFDTIVADASAHWDSYIAATIGSGVTMINQGGFGGVNGQNEPDAGGPGGPGFVGAILVGGSLINDGVLSGGNGGAGGYREVSLGVTISAGNGGDGAVGLYVLGGYLINRGAITGGAGGAGGVGGGTAGVGADGVVFLYGGTLIDDGAVYGGGSTAINFGTGAADLIIDPAAKFVGAVIANASFSNVLELTTGSGTGTIAGLGSGFTGFGTIDFRAGAMWLASGNTAGIASGQTIEGFAHHDTIELTGFVATSDTFTGSGLVLNGGAATIGITGGFSTGDFVVTNDGTNSFVELACFATGTRIACDDGERPVETLRVGDFVRVGPHSSPCPLLSPVGREEREKKLGAIVWIGQRTIECRRHPSPQQVWPVRIRAGAFGDDVPRRDLFLSPDHAVLIDRVLIPVRYLINGTSIAQVAMDRVTYFHVELARHDVLLAEGLPAESYLDRGDRAVFANADVVRLFGGFEPTDACTTWEAAGCAPLVVTGPVVAATRRTLSGRRNPLRGSALLAPCAL